MDEMTKKAIEATKAKESKKEYKAINNDPNIDGGVVEKDSLEGELKNQIKLGENKIVTIKPWTGKTKKKLRKFFENVTSPEDINFMAVIKTLIYDYIKEDVYLNEGELQYLLVKIREISLGDDLNTISECPLCGNENRINVLTKDVTFFTENKLPQKFKDINFVDIKNLKVYENEVKNIMESNDYDGITTESDIEMSLHIDIGKSTKETINYLDEINIKESSEIISELRKVLPSCVIKENKNCSGCQNDVDFVIDVSTTVFEELLK